MARTETQWSLFMEATHGDALGSEKGFPLRVMIKQPEFGFPNYHDKLASKHIYSH